MNSCCTLSTLSSPLVNWAAYELGLDITMGNRMENPHPFGQIPCLRDDNDVVVFESGAILIYLNSVSTKTLTEKQRAAIIDRKSTRLNSSHRNTSRMPSSA